MMTIYIAASIIGGVMTASLFGQHDLLTGILSGPVGGSMLTAMAALLLADPSSPRKQEAVPRGVIWC
jgi:hypothetical protein